MPSMLFHRWRLSAALFLLALLSACGQADQAALQPSVVPLAPISPIPQAATTTPGTRPTPLSFRPTPGTLQQAATITAETIETNVAANLQTADAEITATAAWALTPEPTIVPPASTTRLREVWPASPQAASAPSRLYLRSPSFSEWKPDLFWEVRLPDLHLRRLPTLEQSSHSDTALVSPDGRFLAYVTGFPPSLRVLNLTSDTDHGIALPIVVDQHRCHRPIAWSPDGRTFATLEVIDDGPRWTGRLLLFEPQASSLPQPLLHLPGAVRLLGWLDNEHLLLVNWSRKVVEPARLVVVDRQGNQSLLGQLAPGIPRCSSLSPDGRDLIYEQDHHSFQLQLASGQQRPFFPAPDAFFWVDDGRTLLVSLFGRDRWVWVRSFDQPRHQRLFLSPPYQADYRFGITGVSPDGRLLVACEQPSGDNPRIHSFVARTWLYNIGQDRWTLIRDSATRGCDVVLGWSSPGATP